MRIARGCGSCERLQGTVARPCASRHLPWPERPSVYFVRGGVSSCCTSGEGLCRNAVMA